MSGRLLFLLISFALAGAAALFGYRVIDNPLGFTCVWFGGFCMGLAWRER